MCNTFVFPGAGQEMSKVKVKLQDAIAGRSIAEDMNAALQVGPPTAALCICCFLWLVGASALCFLFFASSFQLLCLFDFQDEIRELKEQVTLYETASQYGVYPSDKPSGKHHDMDPDDSYAQLGIKQQAPPPVWKTPDNST